MKKVLFILLIVFFLASFWSQISISQSTKVINLEQRYSDYIDNFISRCQSKAERRHSKFVNIRREAVLYDLKAHFYESHKKELIENMIAENIGTKSYKIHYYLNNKFFNMLETALASLHHVRSKDVILLGG